MNEEFSALSRTLGVMAGTGYGHWARDRNMSLSDVLEADFAGYIGAQTAVAFTDIFADQSNVTVSDLGRLLWRVNDSEWDSPEMQAGLKTHTIKPIEIMIKVYDVHQRRKLKWQRIGSS